MSLFLSSTSNFDNCHGMLSTNTLKLKPRTSHQSWFYLLDIKLLVAMQMLSWLCHFLWEWNVELFSKGKHNSFFLLLLKNFLFFCVKFFLWIKVKVTLRITKSTILTIYLKFNNTLLQAFKEPTIFKHYAWNGESSSFWSCFVGICECYVLACNLQKEAWSFDFKRRTININILFEK